MSKRRDDRLTRAMSALFATGVLFATPTADAVPRAARFSDLARQATDAPSDLRSLASPLLADCTGLSDAATRQCVQARRRRGAGAARTTWLIELPGEGHVDVGPFEPSNGGFRIRVPGLALLPGPGERGVLSTRALTNGTMPVHAIADGFVHVTADQAERWWDGNTPEHLAVRCVVRFGLDWIDATASDPARSYGVKLEVLGVQVYNEASGNVLLDSLENPPRPPEPPLLEGRLPLWSQATHAEARWIAPSGETVLLHVRLESTGPEGAVEAIVMAHRGASPTELARFVAPCCSSAVDVRAHGPNAVLVILTEAASNQNAAGRGHVVLARWDETSHRLLVRARWSGDNAATPPAWVVDPNAPAP